MNAGLSTSYKCIIQQAVKKQALGLRYHLLFLFLFLATTHQINQTTNTGVWYTTNFRLQAEGMLATQDQSCQTFPSCEQQSNRILETAGFAGEAPHYVEEVL